MERDWGVAGESWGIRFWLLMKMQLRWELEMEMWSETQALPSDLAGVLSLAFVQVSSIRRQKFMLGHGFPHLIQLFLSSEPSELYFILLRVCVLSHFSRV